MDYTHLHLMLTHIPIVGNLIGTFILLFAFWKKNQVLQNASMILIVVMALFTIPVFLTGEPAEETVESLPGVIESIIEEHEEAAEFAMWLMMISGVAALGSLVVISMKSRLAGMMAGVTLVISLLATASMFRTGYLGGQIRHSEIRSGGMANAQLQVAGEQGEDDDD